MEELSSKKNTDCVYFLASPLTCKKGMQCEFRHSEVARLNPRDCWYWLAGNCLNPDCAFRHPPLDAEEEENPSPEPTSSSTKGRIPCYFYSQGYCAKGDKCSFMHGYPRVYNSSSNQNQQNQQQRTTVTATTTTTLTNVPKSAAAASISNKGFRKTVEEPPRETTLTEAMVPEEEKHIEGQVECSSPNEYQPQEFDEEEEPAEKLQDLVVNHRHIDWPLRIDASSPGYDEPAAETDLYCDDESYEGEEEEEEEDTVLDPGNAPRPLQSLHRAVEPSYEFSWPHLQNSSNGIREPFTNYKIFDPPYQPSVPYDCMISSRQGFMEEHRIHESPEFEALFMARNLGGGMSRRRLEDRLVFPKNSASSNSIANRLKLLNSATNGGMNLSSGGGGNQQEDLELQAALYGTPHGLRLEKTPMNLRRNGGVLSRLGSSRPSVKSRLRFTNHRQQQHFHQHHHHHQQQQQQQFHYHHQQHRQRNARYLGLVQRRHNNNNNSSKASSKKTSSSHSRRVFSSSINNNNNNSSSSSSLLVPGAKDSQFSSQFSSQFDGPKSLAELKAAKTPVYEQPPV